MFRKISLAVGFAAGYAVGARAGLEPYQRLRALLRASSRLPAVQRATTAVSSAGGQAVRGVRSSVDGAVGDITARLDRSPAEPEVTPTSEAALVLDLDSLSIDELSERELDLLTTPEPTR